ncbi:trypsin-like peptidase domain-containing protein [uncultured Maribacter sp.]|mgnify:FL=1|uniref:S1C family serine protease n=1 Tax=uncultured Maribacter sp. TaxID=431308 RepID=UPI0030EC83FC
MNCLKSFRIMAFGWKFSMLLLLFFCSSCMNTNSKENLELKRKELELKERELELKKQELELNSKSTKGDSANTTVVEKESLSTMYNKVKNGVYVIHALRQGGAAQGSAFVVDKSGLAISNYHVFDNASMVMAVNEHGDKFMITEIIDYNEEQDYVIFRLGNQENVKFLPIAGLRPSIGESCFAIGNPKGLTQTLSTGVISGLRGDNFLQTTAEITHGSSGGPLFNGSGQVIGITTSGLGEANLNFAVDINSIPIKQYLNTLRSNNTASNLSNSELKNLVKNYYNILVNENWRSLLNIYSNNLNRFYDKFGVANYEAVSAAKNYKSEFGIYRTEYDIRWDTFKTKRSNLGTEIRFTMDYNIVRKESHKASSFVLKIIMVVDNNNKVKGIYENIISKF